MSAEVTATAVISRSHSYCSNCNKNVIPHGYNKRRHVDEAGWSGKKGEGCDAVFVNKSTDQLGQGAEYTNGMWDHLPFIPYNEVNWRNV